MRRIAVLVLLLGLAVLATWLVVRPSPVDGPSVADRSASAKGQARDPRLRGTTSDATGEAGEATADAAEGGPIPAWPIGEIAANDQGAGRVFVRLVDAEGSPLADHPLEVSWWKAFGVYGENVGRTDEDGRFRTEADEPWEVENVATPAHEDEEFSMLLHAGPFVPHPGQPEEIVVELPPTGIVHGRIVDLEGNGEYRHVLVERLTRFDPSPFVHRLGRDEISVETDDEGRFEVLVVAGTYTLRLDGSGPLTHHAVVTIDRARRRAEVELRIAEPREGRTLDVRLRGLPEGEEPQLAVHVRSDDAGFEPPPAVGNVGYEPAPQRINGRKIAPRHHRIEGLTGDAWELFVWERSSGSRTVPVPPGAAEMTVTLEPSPTRVEKQIRVIGRLADGTLVRPTVQLRRDGDLGGGGWARSAHDGEEGEPVWLYGTKRSYVVCHDGDTAYAGVGPVRATDAPTKIEIPLEPAREASVTFTDAAGRGLFCEIVLRPAWALFRSAEATGQTTPSAREGFAPCTLDLHRIATEDGKATFGMLGSTPYEVLVRPSNPAVSPARGVIRGGESLSLTPGQGLEGRTTLTGRVVDTTSGEGVANAKVRATTKLEGTVLGTIEAVTHPDGRFTLRGLPPGPAVVRTRLRGYAYPPDTTITLGPASGPLEIGLEPARWVSLLLLDAGGRPLGRTSIEMRRQDGTLVTFQDRLATPEDDFAVTDVDGRVDLGGVPAALVRVLVTVGEDEEPVEFQVDVREPPDRLITLRLPR